jgi:hypothetical protein
MNASSASELKTEFLFKIRLNVELPAVATCPTGAGDRKIFTVKGGTFEGPHGTGVVLPGGTDWAFAEADGLLRLDVRAILRTADDALISVAYKGLLDPASGYWRTTPVFETTAEKYRWLTRVVTVGVGERGTDGPIYRIYVVR